MLFVSGHLMEILTHDDALIKRNQNSPKLGLLRNGIHAAPRIRRRGQSLPMECPVMLTTMKSQPALKQNIAKFGFLCLGVVLQTPSRRSCFSCSGFQPSKGAKREKTSPDAVGDSAQANPPAADPSIATWWFFLSTVLK